jgi:hypothetical protein
MQPHQTGRCLLRAGTTVVIIVDHDDLERITRCRQDCVAVLTGRDAFNSSMTLHEWRRHTVRLSLYCRSSIVLWEWMTSAGENWLNMVMMADQLLSCRCTDSVYSSRGGPDSIDSASYLSSSSACSNHFVLVVDLGLNFQNSEPALSASHLFFGWRRLVDIVTS